MKIRQLTETTIKYARKSVLSSKKVVLLMAKVPYAEQNPTVFGKREVTLSLYLSGE